MPTNFNHFFCLFCQIDDDSVPSLSTLINSDSVQSSRALNDNNKRSTIRAVPLTDDIYKKPFEYGWKRELVLRAIPDQSKEKGEVYYITPTGKKLRTRTEIQMNLTDDLVMANFTLAKEALGVGPQDEIIRFVTIKTDFKGQ